jgi:glycosyltransferase involved in cell wall biosynthesis
MWQSAVIRPPYAMHEIELTEPTAAIRLAEGEGGAHVLVRHRGRPVGRFWMVRAHDGAELPAERVAERATLEAGARVGALAVRDALTGGAPRCLPPLTIAVCTRNRAMLLRRCLAALVVLRNARSDDAVEILVVDNAPPDDGTRAAVAEFAGVRYAMEPVPGLDFARNRALVECRRDWLAFVDDDAVVDRGWLDALAEGVAASPGAGGFTGPVLPLMLETEAQLRFERAGGFGKGFHWTRFGPEVWGDPIYPAQAGRFGTGASMVFATTSLRALGGFDEALDTGPPLPGGGDLDMFYRVVRGGWPLVYLPGLLVHHEHRRDMPGLRRQYHSWGTSVMALLRKNVAAEPTMRARHRRFLRRWWHLHLRRLAAALFGLGVRPPGLVLAQIWGGVQGYFGEYARSQVRIAERKRTFAGKGPAR